jgi:dTDP-4-amino-4,6-dideoxygalactose transaminase
MAQPRWIVPLLDLRREHAAIAGEIKNGWDTVLGSMQLLNGENVSAFEQEIAGYLGAEHAIGVASGSDALVLALRSAGIGPGDEVIVHANSFVAALEAVCHTGARPVLVDCAAENEGPDLQGVEAAISSRTRAVIAVHLYGSPLPLSGLAALCADSGIELIEDASHAHGAARHGRKVGTFGRAGCFSAGVVKNLGAYGDAGFIVTGDAELAGRVRLLQSHGQRSKNEHLDYGYNSRLDELQAVVLRVRLRRLEARNARRRAIAAHYRERFAGLDLHVPREQDSEAHVYHQFVVRSPRRDALRAALKEAGIETGIHYPVPLHRQPAWLRRYREAPALPRCEQRAREILSLPVFPDLTDGEIEYVVDRVVAFHRAA